MGSGQEVSIRYHGCTTLVLPSTIFSFKESKAGSPRPVPNGILDDVIFGSGDKNRFEVFNFAAKVGICQNNPELILSYAKLLSQNRREVETWTVSNNKLG